MHVPQTYLDRAQIKTKAPRNCTIMRLLLLIKGPYLYEASFFVYSSFVQDLQVVKVRV